MYARAKWTVEQIILGRKNQIEVLEWELIVFERSSFDHPLYFGIGECRWGGVLYTRDKNLTGVAHPRISFFWPLARSPLLASSREQVFKSPSRAFIIALSLIQAGWLRIRAAKSFLHYVIGWFPSCSPLRIATRASIFARSFNGLQIRKIGKLFNKGESVSRDDSFREKNRQVATRTTRKLDGQSIEESVSRLIARYSDDRIKH